MAAAAAIAVAAGLCRTPVLLLLSVLPSLLLSVGMAAAAATAAAAGFCHKAMKAAITNVSLHCYLLFMMKRSACVQGPFARHCHPREEHLLPLMVAAGAARCRQAQVTFNEKIMGAKVSGFMWN